MSQRNQGFLARFWTEYCLGCSVYAMRYLVKKRMSVSERLWWAFWIGSSISACCLTIVVTYRKWNANPVFISYDNRLMPIWAVPFPAITICPLAKARVEYLNITDAYFRSVKGVPFDTDQYENLRVVAHVCPLMMTWYTFQDRFQENCVEVMQNISIPMEDQIISCTWRNSRVPCRMVFSQSITDSGICYTFNAIAAEELYKTENLQNEYNYSSASINSENWTLEEGYRDEDDVHGYPVRPIGYGIRSGLTLILSTRKIDEEYLCDSPMHGFKVALHSPDEMPSLEDYFYRLPSVESLRLIVKPELTFISKRLRKHALERRNCYFSGERSLRFFKVYNQNNCLAECIANFTVQECGCVKFSMPRTGDVRICDASELFCYQDVGNNILNAFREFKSKGDLEDPCGCLPACATVKYDVEITHQPFNFTALSKAYGRSTERYQRIDPSILAVAFKSKWMLPLKRQELAGFSDMFAKFGGLFGVIMGASTISLLEVLYFCIIRPWRNDLPEDPVRIQQVLPWLP